MLFAAFMLAFYIVREFALTILVRVLTLVWNIITCGGQKGAKTLQREKELAQQEMAEVGGDSMSDNIL